jgi:phage regulator Rha-like protein
MSIVTIQNNNLVTTTLAIANGTDNDHASVIKLVRTYQGDFDEFGRVGFEILPFETNGGIQQREVAFLNQEQSTLLMTYMRNNEIVRSFKKRLVKEFFDMARARQSALPDNRQLALMVIAEADRADRAEAELDAAQPALQFMEEVATHECERHIGTVHKELFNRSIKLAEFRKWLQDNRWMMKVSNEATAWAVDRGYMRQRAEIINGKQFSVPVITAKGYETIRHLFREGELFIRIPGKGIAVQRTGAGLAQ